MKHQQRFHRDAANRIVSIVALLAGLSLAAWAAVGGGVSGTVTDTKGAAVSGARVTAVSAAQGIQTRAMTDAKGGYRFPTLAVGVYDLRVEAAGYKTSVHKIAIHVDDKLRFDVTLESSEP